MAKQMVYSRPLTCSWTGAPSPLATMAELLAQTDPAVGAWTSFEVMADNMRGYCLGYGSYLANPMFVSDNRMVYLRQLLTLCGTKAVVCCASNYEAQQYSRLLAELGLPIVVTHDLAAGYYGYNGIDWWDNYETVLYIGASAANASILAQMKASVFRGKGIVYLHDANTWSNIDFATMFAELGIGYHSQNYLHCYPAAIAEYIQQYATDASWVVPDLGSRLFIAGVASYVYTAARPVVQRSGYAGHWMEGHEYEVLAEEQTVLDTVTAYLYDCCPSEGQQFNQRFDYSAQVVQPDDFAQVAPRNYLQFDWSANTNGVVSY